MSQWTHLIRFIAREDAGTYTGQLVDTSTVSSIGPGTQAYVVAGDPLGTYGITREVKTVEKLLAPVSKESVPIVRCVGLNYAKHVAEGRAISHVPKWPTLFIKPRTSIGDPFTPVPVPKVAQDESLDYEAEMCLVIKKDALNVPSSGDEWKEYVAGYMCGDDISWRKAQIVPELSGTQWCMGKGLNGFAPVGPVLVSSEAIDHSKLDVSLRLNGETMQSSNTEEMVHKVRDILAKFSEGTTLEKGTVIMTGTPDGVGFVRKPNVYLKDGDQVEVEIEGLGILKHAVLYE
ncbi:hypothetical protein JAAARDRAFT_140041 [Jaapia argillacea MUCL 33604]|uniref:Fumarylacetoacetase-like C-terminal domain-containing protein n=1 Tax=Jaapia argillacea MUCL 33604 TaxID=933084 RepID=A0A067PMK2_9AGAM|nr:hypothetical protein JAAARDRAFT_140041 [Jaapia argillacea MUCL 33604]